MKGARGLTNQEMHVGTPIEKCRVINDRLLEAGQPGAGYPKDIFDNLVFRYEEPNGMTRWDSPLFTIPWDDETPPFEAIWKAMIGSDGNIKTVKPNLATVMVRRYIFFCEVILKAQFKFRAPSVMDNRKLIGRHRHLHPSLITCMSLIRFRRMFSTISWNGRGTILGKEAEKLPPPMVIFSCQLTQYRYPCFKGCDVNSSP